MLLLRCLKQKVLVSLYSTTINAGCADILHPERLSWVLGAEGGKPSQRQLGLFYLQLCLQMLLREGCRAVAVPVPSWKALVDSLSSHRRSCSVSQKGRPPPWNLQASALSRYLSDLKGKMHPAMSLLPSGRRADN